jgi:hypothetical protein
VTEREKLGAKLDPALRDCALRHLPPACTVFPRATESSDPKGGSMPRKRLQRGCVVLKGQVWYGKHRDDVCGARWLAERKLEQVLCRINAVEYRPGRVATLAEFAERWKVEILTKGKDSTRVPRNHTSRSISFRILGNSGSMRSASKISRRTVPSIARTVVHKLPTPRH